MGMGQRVVKTKTILLNAAQEFVDASHQNPEFDADRRFQHLRALDDNARADAMQCAFDHPICAIELDVGVDT